MNEVITVEVSGKFGPKANGKWYGVKRPLKASDFRAGQQYEITTEDWASNGKSGVNIVSKHDLDKVDDTKTVVTEVKEKVTRATPSSETLSYDDKKNTRILVQGITQAALQCMALAGLPGITVAEIAKNAKQLATEMIAYVKEQLAE